MTASAGYPRTTHTVAESDAERQTRDLAAIIEQSDDAIISKTLTGIVTNWNKGAERLFGYRAEEMIGQPIARVIPEDRLEEESQILARLGRGERVDHYETVRRRSDGRLIDVSLSVAPVRDAEGRVIGASKIARDITERKRSDAVAREAQERLREQAALLELAPVLVRDMDNRIELWTQGAERLYGYSKEEAIGRVAHELFQTQGGIEELDKALRRDGKWEGELIHRKRNGQRLVVVSQQIVFLDSSGRAARVFEVNADITERKRAEQSLKESRSRFEGVIESAMDAIITIDEAQRVILFNTAAERMFGYSAPDALGQSLDRFIPVRYRSAHQAHVRVFEATGVTSRAMGKLGDLLALRADGKEFPIEASISQTEVDGAKLFTVILRDITERKEAEERLSRSESQLRALAARLQRAREEEGMRIARELHDQLGRCLTSLKMDLLWIEKTVSQHPADENIHSINEKTRMMLEAVDETVTVVRRISSELRPGILDDLGLAAAVEWQAGEFQTRSGVSCIVNIPEEDLELSRDQATAYFRIFQEILTNVARHSRASKIWVHLEARDGIVTLEVEDDGVGISPDAASRPHALGLAGMRERAAIFGGDVEISGIPGKGTTVIVRMPIDENPGR
jgi:PAS domain S-box-containing protein